MSSTSSIRNLLPRSFSSKRKSTSNPKFPNSDAENTPPTDPNIIQINHHKSLPITAKQSHSETPISTQSNTPLESDTSVKVAVRIRPTSNIGIGDEGVKKVYSDTLCVGDRQFRLDSIFDSKTTQEDIFQSVGVPLVVIFCCESAMYLSRFEAWLNEWLEENKAKEVINAKEKIKDKNLKGLPWEQ
ncbi:hypothetical protein P8452_49611 [Trifolium repens]|nr:hypothetical protein P8452_49611 [Trifolium repens]